VPPTPPPFFFLSGGYPPPPCAGMAGGTPLAIHGKIPEGPGKDPGKAGRGPEETGKVLRSFFHIPAVYIPGDGDKSVRPEDPGRRSPP